MEERRVLLSFRESNKLCCVKLPITEDGIKTVAKDLFQYYGPSIVQYFDEEWSTYIDFNPEDGKDKKKFKIVPTESQVLLPNSPSVSFPIIIDVPSPSTTKDYTEWPRDLIFDESVISISILTVLKERKVLSYKERNILIHDLVQYMLKFTTYPSSEKYELVAKTLITNFPHLEEKIGNGFSGWKQKLRDQFKNIRRRMEDSPVKRKKEKYGNRKTSSCLFPDPNAKDSISDDDESLASTFTFRRELIYKKTPFAEIRALYPSLFLETKEISDEMQRITGTAGVVGEVKKWLVLNGKCIKDFIVAKKTLPKETNTLNGLLLNFRNNSLLPEEEKDMISGSILLPAVFLEKHDAFIKILQETDLIEEKINCVTAPTIFVVGDPFCPKSKKIVIAEASQLLSSTDLPEVIGTLLCLFFVLHCEYPKEIKNTMMFLQSVMKISSAKPSVKVINFVEKFNTFKDNNS